MSPADLVLCKPTHHQKALNLPMTPGLKPHIDLFCLPVSFLLIPCNWKDRGGYDAVAFSWHVYTGCILPVLLLAPAFLLRLQPGSDSGSSDPTQYSSKAVLSNKKTWSFCSFPSLLLLVNKEKKKKKKSNQTTKHFELNYRSKHHSQWGTCPKTMIQTSVFWVSQSELCRVGPLGCP